MSTERDISGFTEGNDIYRQFQLVFKELYAPLCQYAFTFLKDKDACEDIVQEIFTRIWEKNRAALGTYGDGIRFYLFNAVRNNCLTFLSREKRLPVYSLDDRNMDRSTLHEWGDSAQEGDFQANYKARLAEYIEQLPPKCKEVFLLTRMGQLSHREVASALDISVKTVENQLWKAMKILRELARTMNLC